MSSKWMTLRIVLCLIFACMFPGFGELRKNAAVVYANASAQITESEIISSKELGTYFCQRFV